jgi:hypothetical protein
VEKVSRVFFEVFDLTLNPFSGVIIGVDFINPERFMIEGIESQGEADQ